MKATIPNIIYLFTHFGQQQYGGEEVSQLQHALQCATLAQENGATNELVTACLLHDIGHLLHPLEKDIALRGVDPKHEKTGACWLRLVYPAAITEPIRLHVAAKRYLCATDQEYFGKLSQASKSSLALQGGIFTAKEAEEFVRLPYAEEAIALRRWDEEAKVKDFPTQGLERFI